MTAPDDALEPRAIIPPTEFSRDVPRQVILGALKWRSLTEPLAVSVHGEPDERGHYPIAATPWMWAMHHESPEPWIRGEAWVENRHEGRWSSGGYRNNATCRTSVAVIVRTVPMGHGSSGSTCPMRTPWYPDCHHVRTLHPG
jgi:hypothetical protein